VLRNLWASAQKVRTQLNADGVSQAALEKGRNALHVEGVIYAIYSFVSRRIYVGQTVHSCLYRFEQHVQAALRGSQNDQETELYKAMVKYGVQNFFSFPLEVIPRDRYKARANWKIKNPSFKKVADVREQFWIERLHSYSPNGFNMAMSQRRRHRKHKGKKNPMKWARSKRVANRISENAHNPEQKNVAEARGRDISVPASPVGSQVAKPDNVAPEYPGRRFGYRDYLRRIQHLSRVFQQNGSLEHIDFGRYKPGNLWRMMALMEKEDHDLPQNAVKAILVALRGFLQVRNQPGSVKRNTDGCIYVKLNWTSRELRRIPLKKVLEDRELARLLPREAREALANILVIRKLGRPIGCSVFNYAQFSRKLPPLPEPSEQCPCRKLFPDSKVYRDRETGCVCTGSLDIVQSEELRALLSKGPRYRTNQAAEPMTAVGEAVQKLTEKLNMEYHLGERDCAAWKSAILAKCKSYLEERPAAVPRARVLPQRQGNTEQPLVFTREMRRSLFLLRKHLVLVPTDKAANNVAFICKSLYASILRKELTRADGAYEEEKRGEDEIVCSHDFILKPDNLQGKRKLPYVYWTPKFHKQPRKERFIAGSAKCSTTKLSKVLSDVLLLVLRTLREKDNENIRQTGVRRFFPVEGYEEVANCLSKYAAIKRRGGRLKSGDFSTMYTTIPHDDLIKRVKEATDEAWEYMRLKNEVEHGRDITIVWKKGQKAKWCIDPNKPIEHTHRFSKDKIGNLVALLVQNTFVVNGRKVRRQRRGIPMGTNCGPVLVNLYLYRYESMFIDKCLADPVLKDRAADFHMSFRFIDDTLSVDNAYWMESIRRPHEEGGIYPRALIMNDTTVSDTLVNFVGMSIEYRMGKLSVKPFDKRNEFPFAVRRYPHMDSLIPCSLPYGVFTGQLYRYARICTEWKDFVANAANLAKTLMIQGCAKGRLVQAFHAFTEDKGRLIMRIKVNVSSICAEFKLRLGSYP
jgi:hypothetical protein